MTALLDQPPYAPRDEAAFLDEMNALCRRHLAGCEPYARMHPQFRDASDAADLPFIHVSLFKRLELRTQGGDTVHQRTLTSSATSGVASRIALDAQSSALQSRSVVAILADFLGAAPRPLLILDSAASLLRRGEVSARIAAALSLKPMATDLQFLLRQSDDPGSLDFAQLDKLAQGGRGLIVYGFTWMLYQAWAQAEWPPGLAHKLRTLPIQFVHSGGWKKLEALRVERQAFDRALLETAGPGSQVIDYYGLVEQVGVVFPLCPSGFRHVPRWAQVIARDVYTGEPVFDRPGLLQFMNVLARGAPYHSVLTEDVGQVWTSACPCGRVAPRFELLGRVPDAEVRGCANV